LCFYINPCTVPQLTTGDLDKNIKEERTSDEHKGSGTNSQRLINNLLDPHPRE